MPFLTEELWHALYDGEPPAKSIALTRYPLGAAHNNDRFEADFALLQELIVSVRAAPQRPRCRREGLGPDPHPCSQRRPRLRGKFEIIQTPGARLRRRISEHHARRRRLFAPRPQFDVAVIYEKTIDVAAERERLSKELAKLEKGLASAERQLSNPAFLEKAPPHVVEGLRKMEADTRLLIEKTRKALADLTQEGPG